MHQIVLYGRLGRDIDFHSSSSGHDVANLRVGVPDVFKKDGRRQKKTLWFDVVAFDGLARVCADNLRNESGVLITGRLNFREYESREKQRVKTFEVVADTVTFTDPPPDGYGRDEDD